MALNFFRGEYILCEASLIIFDFCAWPQRNVCIFNNLLGTDGGLPPSRENSPLHRNIYLPRHACISILDAPTRPHHAVQPTFSHTRPLCVRVLLQRYTSINSNFGFLKNTKSKSALPLVDRPTAPCLWSTFLMKGKEEKGMVLDSQERYLPWTDYDNVCKLLAFLWLPSRFTWI